MTCRQANSFSNPSDIFSVKACVLNLSLPDERVAMFY